MTFSVKTSAPCNSKDRPVSLEDFCRYLVQPSAYIFIPCREIWPASSVNARLPRIPVLTKSGQPKHDKDGKPLYMAATKWIDNNCRVEQMTWHPGLPMFIKDRLAVAGGWVEKRGTTSFNQYRAPQIIAGDKGKAKPWLEHVRRIYPDDADHIINWLAWHRQHPGDKVNHAIVLGGAQGIGKDSLLQPVKYAVGPWNFQEIKPPDLMCPFNGYAETVVLRINEAHDLGEFDRFKFYDRVKVYTTTPPDTLRVNKKHLKEYYVYNCLGVVITTNHKTDGLYLPADDRRHYVAWSNYKKEDFSDDYWRKLWRYYENEGGYEHVTAYLDTLDLSGFDPKAPPPKTPAFWDIVNANSAPEDTELADLLEGLGDPNAVTIDLLCAAATGETSEWLLAKKSPRTVRHRLDRCGYVSVHNPSAQDGRWPVQLANGKSKKQMIYAKASLCLRDQCTVAESLKCDPGAFLRAAKAEAERRKTHE
jgi:Family of unknown function (DUF5906)